MCKRIDWRDVVHANGATRFPPNFGRGFLHIFFPI